MTITDFKKSIGKSQGWLRGTKIKEEIINRYGNFSIESIKAYESYTVDLLNFIEEAWRDGKFKTRDILDFYNADTHKNKLVCANFLLNTAIFRIREPYDFFYMTTMRKLEKLREIILSQNDNTTCDRDIL